MSICDLQIIREVDSVSQFKEGQGKFMDHRSIKEMLVEKAGINLLIFLIW